MSELPDTQKTDLQDMLPISRMLHLTTVEKDSRKTMECSENRYSARCESGNPVQRTPCQEQNTMACLHHFSQ